MKSPLIGRGPVNANVCTQLAHNHGPRDILAIETLAARSVYRVYWAMAFVGGKKMTIETMIGSLSRDEKLTAMDLIWQDLAADSQAFVSPKWHETIIAERLDNPDSGVAMPLAEAKNEIKEAIDARRASG